MFKGISLVPGKVFAVYRKDVNGRSLLGAISRNKTPPFWGITASCGGEELGSRKTKKEAVQLLLDFWKKVSHDTKERV